MLDWKEVATAAVYECFLDGEHAVSWKHERFCSSMNIANISKEKKVILVLVLVGRSSPKISSVVTDPSVGFIHL